MKSSPFPIAMEGLRVCSSNVDLDSTAFRDLHTLMLMIFRNQVEMTQENRRTPAIDLHNKTSNAGDVVNVFVDGDKIVADCEDDLFSLGRVSG